MSLHTRRKLLPWLFLGPGLLWLLIFFLYPLLNQASVSLMTGNPEQGYDLTWAFHNYWDAISEYKEQFGRGPTKTRTQWSGPDVLVVTLEKTLTPAEHSLCRLGKHGKLRDLRLLFQYGELERFCEPIERLTGRKVRGFISGIDTVASTPAACVSGQIAGKSRR